MCESVMFWYGLKHAHFDSIYSVQLSVLMIILFFYVSFPSEYPHYLVVLVYVKRLAFEYLQSLMPFLIYISE